VKDVDATYRAALDAGAKSKDEPKDQFYGDRSAKVIDPFGVEWGIMTHVEDVSPKEMQRRMAAMPPPQ
jgi:PhnB protein